MDELQRLQDRIHELETNQNSMKMRLEELQDFVENASLPLHWVNGSGIIIWANKAELDLLGYERGEYINQHISKFHADKDVIEDILKRLVDKKKLINCPARLKCKDGSLKYVLVNSSVYWNEDKFVHTRCFTTDITFLADEAGCNQFMKRHFSLV